MNKESTKYRRDLRRTLAKSFNLSELGILTTDLGVNWDDLRGETLQEKAQALIQYLAMRGQLQDLIDLGKEERPKIDWPTIPDADQQIEDQKADISEAERRAIFDNLMDKVGPLANSVMQIKSLVEANIGYLDTAQTGVLVRLLASSNLASYIKLDSITLNSEDLQKIALGISRSSLAKADLHEANLKEADLRGANLVDANLSGANLRKADLDEADLRGAKLVDATLSNTNLHWARLDWANLRGAFLGGAILVEANLVQVDLFGARLHGANLYRANLYGANLKETDLNEANLRDTSLSGAKYNNLTRWPDGFDPVAAGAIKIED